MPPRRPDAVQLGAYFGLMEVAGLLRHAVEQQLHDDGDLTYVQFQLLARLGLDSATGSERMTDLADALVHSRSGLTYQVGLLQKRGLVTREQSADDDRGITVTITPAGRDLVEHVMPGHVDVVAKLLFDPLSRSDLRQLGEILTPVRDHMRNAPPRSAATRKRRTTQ